MGQPFVGEIRMFAGNFAPAGWMFCEGQLLPISENETLFNLIGTTYGGDGQETFALPDLRGRVPIHQGTGPGLTSRQLAETGGTETVTLTTNTIPIHTHPALCNDGTGASTSNPNAGTWTTADTANYLSTGATTGFMGTPSILSSPVGGSQPHENLVPYLCVDFIISLFGIFPTPS
jgi:microcystin-dependent protein